MKKLLSAAAVAALASAASQVSAQVLYEPYNHPLGAQLDTDAAGANKNYTTSGTFWSSRGTQTGLFTIGTGLGAPTDGTVPPLPTPMGNAELWPTSGATGRVPVIGFGQTFTTEGDYYYSLVLKTPSSGLGATSGTMAGFVNFAIPTPNAPSVFQAGLRYVSQAGGTTFRLGMASGGVTQDVSTKTFNAGDTVFIVGRYHINPATRTDDSVALWLNPTSGFGDNGAIPAPDVSFTHVNLNSDSVDAVVPNPMLAGFVTRYFSSTIGFQIDELRVDNTWAGVTPDGTKQYTFNNAAGGNWSDANTWNDYQNAPTASNPSALGDVANFGTNINSGSIINVDGGGKTVDAVNFTNTGNLTLQGNTLTFSSNASAAQIYVYGGDHAITAPVVMDSNLSIKTAPGATLHLGLVAGTGKTLGIYGQGTVVTDGPFTIADDVRVEVRSGTLNLNGQSETVGDVQLGTSHPNNGSAISLNMLYNGDLASGTISNGTITANSYNLQSGTISAVVAGTNGVTKTLAGRVTLSGNNTYTGTTTVSGGVLTLAGTNSNPITAILNAPPNVFGGTSTLLITSDANLGATGATVEIATAGISTSGTLQFNESMTLASDRTITASHTNSRLAVVAGKTANVDALVTGTGGINVVFPWDPTVASSGVSNTDVRAGALATTGGVLVLRNTGNNYAGNTTVSGGRLLLPNTAVAPGYNVAGKYVTAAAPLYPQSGGVPTSAGAILSVGVGGAGEWSDADIDILRANASFAAGTFLGFDTTNAVSGTHTYGSDVTSGTFGLVKVGTGTLIMPGNHGHSGGVAVSSGTLVLSGNSTYTGQSSVNGGALRVASDNALGSSAPADRTFIEGGPTTGVLEFDGGVTTAETIIVEGRAANTNPTPHINNVGGNNTISTPLTIDARGTWFNIQSDAGKLTIAGINNPINNTTGRVINLKGAGEGEITGPIQNTTGLGPVSVQKHDAGTWTLSGVNTYVGDTTINGGTLAINAESGLGTSTAAIIFNGGALRANNPIAFTRNATVNAGGGAIDTNGVNSSIGTVTGAGAFTKSAGGVLTANQVKVGGAVAVSGGTLEIAPNGTASGMLESTALTVADGALLAMNDNDFIVNYGESDPSPEFAIRDKVKAIYQGGTSGISYTVGAGDTAIAVAERTEWGFSEFNGVALDTTTIVGKYTYFGDANLDGKVTSDDYVAVDVGLGTGDSWVQGDFNFSGTVTSDDYVAIDVNLGKGSPTPLAFAELKAEMIALHTEMFGDEYVQKLAEVEAEGFVALVPEPGALGLVGLGAIGLLGRRRRRA